MTFGSTFSSALSRSFIAYFAKSVLLSYCDCAERVPEEMVMTLEKSSDNLILIDRLFYRRKL